MRLPGTRYQEHGWEQVRKLLGLCSLQVLRRLDLAPVQDPVQPDAPVDALRDAYVEALAASLRAHARTARGEADGNSYGETVAELALALAFELQAYPPFWEAFVATLVAEHGRSGAFWLDPGADGVLRKKVNDMYAGLRDRVDADNYIAATGRDCSPNRMYTYRMLDTAYRDIARLFADWHAHRAQVGAILGRAIEAMPIEARQMKSIAGCKAEWIIAWSASLEQHGGAPGPLHTRSKRFASLKNSPDKIAAMLVEIGDYEELSSNLDHAEGWQGEAGAAAAWLEDYWRVVGDSEAHEAGGGTFDDDRILPARVPDQTEEELAAGEWGQDQDQDLDADCDPAWVTMPVDAARQAAERQVAVGLSLPPRYMELARSAQASGSRLLRILCAESLPIRLAVYQKLLGAADDTYPDAWCDPATGELPTLAQLAALDGISMPTLRKRRDQAIDKLRAAKSHDAAPAP
ncbi:hypothetical protein [Duganella phyllosphaerae]|uniref:Uncharacterized protein n=1 Tax=Duganella phyllosphaerae TaxID=762836 RepID=A0A1E7X6Z4_9BURK|nr:hypothetical protein [Duganella phyllosphaerae]OFA08904.1 hypothetical protein DUPY_03960 [Duganella phyllosphaerae]